MHILEQNENIEKEVEKFAMKRNIASKAEPAER